MLDILALNYIEIGEKGLSILNTIQLNEFADFDNLILYEVENDPLYKLLCASKKET